MGQLIAQFEGTLERFAADGLLVAFNAPLSCPDSMARAVRMALAMCQQLSELRTQWHSSHYALDFGLGVAHGQATLGMIGFDGRVDYAIMGPVRELALRLCDAAQGGKLLVSQCVWEGVKEHVLAEPAGELLLAGQDYSAAIFEIVGAQT
jgi:class 3 adenylate cyclase